MSDDAHDPHGDLASGLAARWDALDRQGETAVRRPRTTTRQSQRTTCVWTLDDYDGHYDTSCGNAYQLTEGTPRENKMRFCAYCGGRLREK